MEVLKIVLASVGAFAIGFVVLYLLTALFNRVRKKKRRRKRTPEHEVEVKKKTLIARIGTMNLILLIMGVMLFLFTRKMIEMFETYQSTPDTLISCVFALCGGECGVMGWIKNSKERYRDRMWEQEDRKHLEEGGTQNDR